MVELSKENIFKIHQLCKSKEDITLRSCVEGHLGKVWVDNDDNPQIAIVMAADFCYLLGYLNERIAGVLNHKILNNCKGKVIVTDDDLWISVIKNYYPDDFKKFSRYKMKFEPDIIQREQLHDYIMAVEPNYKVKRQDESIYSKALNNGFTADFCCFFSSMEEFLLHGIGYFILDEGEIISGASSYTYCEGSIEITIGTLMEYRRKGLALACASKLILECMDKRIYPNWEAANMNSVALAEKLGYIFEKEFLAYSI